jgi:hypothetical protein
MTKNGAGDIKIAKRHNQSNYSECNNDAGLTDSEKLMTSLQFRRALK